MAQAKTSISNLSAAMEPLLADLAVLQQSAQFQRRQAVDGWVADWNTVHVSIDSFADEHANL